MNYRSFSDLNNAILNNLHKFPHNVDLIVGIPRSGMLPANLLALYLNKPYTDIDSFIENRIISAGERSVFFNDHHNKKVIIIDDSSASGNALMRARDKVLEIANDYEFYFSVVYATSYTAQLVDIYCEIVNPPRIFQWNLFHHPTTIPLSCFDIDGVLCEDPPVDDDGPLYLEYIKNAVPKYLPSVEINTLVTCRLEKYRDVTEEWLKRHNVRYQNLIMLNMASKAERLRWGKHGKYKGEIYKKSPCILFVESSWKQAKEIAKVSNKDVFCTENFTMIKAGVLKTFTQKILRKIRRIIQ